MVSADRVRAEQEGIAHGNHQSLIQSQRRDGAQIQVGIGLNKEQGQIMVCADRVKAEWQRRVRSSNTGWNRVK